MTRWPGLEIRRLYRVAVGTVAMSTLLLTILSQEALAQTKVVPFKNYVSDYAGVIPDKVESQLNSLLKQLQKKTTSQIAVVVINSTEGVPAADYAVEFGQKHGVGKKEVDTGVVFLVAVQDRKLFIATGYGVESILPDGKVGRIRDQFITPHFRKGDMASGIVNGTLALAQEIAKAKGVSLDAIASAPSGCRDCSHEHSLADHTLPRGSRSNQGGPFQKLCQRLRRRHSRQSGKPIEQSAQATAEKNHFTDCGCGD